ncbi:unnamed protein product [Brassicogethes aeneus]|uniref:Tetratricopeptide repeat protein 27 n=1 Tax=Brassicogethes aeneus TaxID=1431903 RepID=A0A9P0AR18_BRAAE|nr:unnamed protein product [Brassicogethes aeneus]
MADLTKLLQNNFLVIEHLFSTPANSAGDIDCTKISWISHETVKNLDVWKTLIDASFDGEQLLVIFNSMSEEEKQKYFKFGVACFTLFVQSNFTGPELLLEVVEDLENEMFKNTDFYKLLSVNNEEISSNTKHPALFVASKCIFAWCIVNNVVNYWWLIRSLIVHQQILDDLSPTLLATADNLFKIIDKMELPENIKASIDIELGQLYLICRHISKAKEYILSASKILGINYNLVGRLGKRTWHQEHEIAQLSLEVKVDEKKEKEPTKPEPSQVDIPADLPLNDEIRLNSIAYSEPTTETKIVLSNIEQKLFLTIVHDMFISKPADELQAEEIQPFVDMILSQKNSYTVRSVALLYRCRLEGKNYRTIERCLLQTEEVINSFKKDSPTFLYRVPDVFGAGLIPIWKVEAQYADLLLNIGLVKNSLEIYLKLELWEEVIVCYTILKLKHKAAEIIKEQLDMNPTVKLWCLLGDATDDISCYETAWEMSKKRSYRAQRHWGQFLFERKKYFECIPHFEKSVSINPLQPNIWFRLGFAALQTENWQVSATAFRRYTTLEPEGFEAWNNLGQAYIKLGNKRSAHQAILEALKCNFENWKVWENLLVVSCDISNFSDVIRAYHKLLDHKGKYMNIEVLSVLVFGVLSEIVDAEGKSSTLYLKKTRELLGRITSIHTSEGYVWELYAILAPTLVLRVQRLQRAYRSYTQTGWDKNVTLCQQVLQVCIKLSEAVLEEEMSPKEPSLNSIRLNISSALAAVKKQDWEDTKELVKEVSEHLDRVVDKIKSGL